MFLICLIFIFNGCASTYKYDDPEFIKKHLTWDYNKSAENCFDATDKALRQLDITPNFSNKNLMLIQVKKEPISKLGDHLQGLLTAISLIAVANGKFSHFNSSSGGSTDFDFNIEGNSNSCKIIVSGINFRGSAEIKPSQYVKTYIIPIKRLIENNLGVEPSPEVSKPIEDISEPIKDISEPIQKSSGAPSI